MPLLEPDQDHPKLLISAPGDLREMYAYWRGKRGARPMPMRTDIDPAEIKGLLPGVLLVVARSPFLDDDCYHLPGQEWSPNASIYLPLSNDGIAVNMVLVYSSFRWIAGGWSPETA